MMRALDLFCGAGGVSMGLHRAGYDVLGVDIEPQPHYPFQFVQADAMTFPLGGVDLICASPPCGFYTGTWQDHSHHPDLIGPVRDRLKASGAPYVIENVATAPLPEAILLCGATFGLPVIRHRKFELSWEPGLIESLCPQRKWGRGVSHGPGYYPYARKKWQQNWRDYVVPVVWPWMTLEEAGQAIPPVYIEYIVKLLRYSDAAG